MITILDLKKYFVEQFLIYLRKSRSDRPEETVEEVLAKHEKDLQEWAIRTFGIPIPEDNIYREVVSGETIKDRPEVQKVLRRIEDEKIIGVIVIEPQRLSRGDWEDGGKILSSFKYSNTLICTPHKIYDLKDEYDYKGFKNELSAGHDFLEYMKVIMDRGLIRNAKEGQYIAAKAPYGYKKVIIDKKKTLAIVESEAEVIRMIFKWRVYDNMGIATIAMKLDELGYKTRTGNPWHPKTIRNILCNSVYIGKMSWKATKVEKIMKDGQIQKVRKENKDEDSHIISDGLHQAIIEQELFDAVQKSFDNHAPMKKRGQMRNPLSSLVTCKKCGYAMIYVADRKRPTKQPRLVCSNRRCTNVSSAFDDVYYPIIDLLKHKIKEFEFKIGTDNNEYEVKLHEEMIENKKKELDKLEKKQNELYNLLEEGIYSKELFIKRNLILEKEHEELQEAYKKLLKEKPLKIDYQELIITYKDVINAMTDDEVSAKEKNILLRSIIDNIYYLREHEEGTNKCARQDTKPELEIFLRHKELS